MTPCGLVPHERFSSSFEAIYHANTHGLGPYKPIEEFKPIENYIDPTPYLEHAEEYWSIYDICECHYTTIKYMKKLSPQHRMTAEEMQTEEWKSALRLVDSRWQADDE